MSSKKSVVTPVRTTGKKSDTPIKGQVELKSVVIQPVNPSLQVVGPDGPVQVYRVQDLMNLYGIKTGKQMRDYLRELGKRGLVEHHFQQSWSWVGPEKFQQIITLLETQFPKLKEKRTPSPVTQ